MAVIDKKVKKLKNSGQAMVETIFSTMLMISLILGTLQIGLLVTGKLLTILAAHRGARANQVKVLDDYNGYTFGFGSDIKNMFAKHPGMGGILPMMGSVEQVDDNSDQVEVEMGQNYLWKQLPFFPHPNKLSMPFSGPSMVTGGMDDVMFNNPLGTIQQSAIAEMPQTWDGGDEYDADTPY
ncbi:MAG: TadE family protein [Elusimicrobiota bacterium]